MGYEIKLPVRGLVEYVFRSGSIESGFRSAVSMTEGAKVHRKIQKTYGESDHSEVFLQARITYENLDFIIEGRCDGLLFSENEVTIDEIKSTSGDIRVILEESYPVHWAQAKCYAYMYAKDHGIDRINIQLTYVQKESGEFKRFITSSSMAELEGFVMDLAKGYAPYARLRIHHEHKKEQSIKKLDFPFPQYRKGQRKLAGAVYKTIQEGKTLFASAPTGIGKTISTVFPSVKAIGEGLIQRIFYLTAKTITRQTAEEAFHLMNKKGLCMKTVTITAKEKICFNEGGRCRKNDCEFADGYYDRINGAVMDIFENETSMDRSVIEQYALKHKVCPFEFSLDLAYAADAVICDYNYVFDPRVSLKRLFGEQKRQTVLLVDEAHNLVDRAREMFSAQLNKSIFLALKRESKGKSKGIFETSGQLNNYFIRLKKEAGGEKSIVLSELPDELNALLEAFSGEAERELVGGMDPEDNQLLLDAYFAAQSWLRIAKLYSDRYVIYAEVIRKDVFIKQFCIDPSELLGRAGSEYRSRILFSATLTPHDYFIDMLGGGTEDYTVNIPSPFQAGQTDVFIQPLSTRYHDRSKSIDAIVKTLSNAVDRKPGNFLIFFPSYQYMNSVYEEWTAGNPDINTIIQSQGMVEADREAFLEEFQPVTGKAFVGFAVLGGIFSEGIDLKGDRLNGVVVVGVGLPQIGFERNLIKKYFSETGKNGFDYAYVYPGINKVLQAGGRLIRSEEDTGTIILVDDRFLQVKYQKMLPDEWLDYQIIR
ncbi:ATP-dependent DNA helicase [Bacillus sp. T33-2]|uniref:ATP-dependent DNA helicase n=1 Tax=Bacillus sp. T33-2 TaxID=2054168 RepID=UPI000C76F40A|nr:ATP-dependent DNA helicase [Bacillus sp. T33-2]PLR94144.1 ATP-dependent helicase [Bacillus sp. T33-2]